MDYDEFVNICKQAVSKEDRPLMLRFTYTKKTGETNEYLVEPYEIKEGYFWGYKHSADESGIRKFFIDMIEDVSIVSRSYEPRWEIKI